MDPIIVPDFPRLSDWAGIWAMESRAFQSLVQAVRQIDLAAHIRHVSDSPPKLMSAVEKLPTKNGQTIAIVRVMGTLMKGQSSMGGTSTVQLRRDVRQAASDSDVAGILLAIDSPGGTTAGTDDFAQEVKAARKSKPVWAHIDDLGASAAYWVASQAERIYANSPTALVGSIGTYMTVYDWSEAFAKEGVKALHFATGPLKGAGTQGTKVTEEQQAYLQELTDQAQQAFDDAVRLGRGLTSKQLSDVRTGAVYTASVAMDRKLIDGIRPLSKTLEEMTRVIGSRGMASDLSHTGGLPMARQTLPMLNE